MSEISNCDLEKYFHKEIYRYHMFQITPIVIISLTKALDKTQTDEFEIIKGDDIEPVKDFIIFATFYETLKEAKLKQALDIHRIHTGNFKSEIPSINGMVEYFRRFIDEKDVDFFISNATNHQLHEEEFLELIKEIEKTNPEYLI